MSYFQFWELHVFFMQVYYGKLNVKCNSLTYSIHLYIYVAMKWKLEKAYHPFKCQYLCVRYNKKINMNIQNYR